MDSKDVRRWNAMEADYRNKRTNSYREGVGQDLQNRDISDVERDTVARSQHKPVVLYVTNLPLDMDEMALQNIFEQEGKVMKVNIPKPTAEATLKYKAKIGFVTMETSRGAQSAIENLNGFLIKGRHLTVKVKLSKEEIARRHEYKEREEQFMKSVINAESDGADASNVDARHSSDGSASAASHYSLSPNSKGDAASWNGSMSVNAKGDGFRKVFDRRPIEGGRHVESKITGVMASSPLNHGHNKTASLPLYQGVPKPPVSVSGSNSRIGQCAHCQRLADLWCKNCKTVFYCNFECQRADWPVHKGICVDEPRIPAAPTEPAELPMPDFDNLVVNVSDNFMEDNREYLNDWVKSTEVRSDSSESSESKPLPMNLIFHSKPSSVGKQERRNHNQKQSQNKLSMKNGSEEPLRALPRNSPMQKSGRRESESQNEAESKEFKSNQRNYSQGFAKKESGRQTRTKSGEFQQRSSLNFPQQDQRRDSNQKMSNQFFSDKDTEHPLQASGCGNENFDKRSESGHKFPQNWKGPSQNYDQEREDQFQPGRVGIGSPNKEGQQHGNVQGGKNTKFQGQSRGKHMHGQREKEDQFHSRTDGFGTQRTRVRSDQFSQGMGQPKNKMPGILQQKQFDDSKGPSQRQSQNKPGQHKQQNDNYRGGPRNKGTEYQQDRSKNRRNSRTPISDAHGTGGEDSNSWKNETPNVPSKEKSPVVPTNQKIPSAGQGANVLPQSLVLRSSALLELHKPLQGLVSYIDNPRSIWVQLCDEIEAYLPAMTEVYAKYDINSSLAASPEVGEMYLCIYMGELSRALMVSMSGSKARIFYVDYGNYMETDVSKLLPMPAEIASFPGMAVNCALQVFPNSSNEWSPEIIASLEKQNCANSICTITPIKKVDSITEVTVVRNSDGFDMTAFLIEQGACSAQTGLSSALPVVPKRMMVSDMPTDNMDYLSVGQHVDVLVLDAADPSCIFLRLFSMNWPCAEFTLKILQAYNADPETSYKPLVGELVVGRFSIDKNWYRAEVLEVHEERNEALLLYIDYRNKEVLPFQELRAIRAEFAAEPIQCFSCTVGGISTPPINQWSQEHVSAYLACLDKYMIADLDSGMNKCTIVVRSIEGRKICVDVVGDENQQTLYEDLSQILEAMLPQPIQPEVLPTFSSKKCESSASRVTEALVVSKLCAASTKSLSAELKTAVIPIGQRLSCVIPIIESCHRFYINLQTSEKVLDDLKETLNSFCSMPPKEVTEGFKTVSVGQLVLVQYSFDSEWYRGSVEKVSDDGTQCSVFFIDYGDRENKNISALRSLPPHVLDVPAQAIPCKLDGIPVQLSEEIGKKFQTIASETVADIQAFGKDKDGYIVQVFLEDISITSLLLKSENPKPHNLDNEANKTLLSVTECQQSESLAENAVVSAEAESSLQQETEEDSLQLSPCPALEEAINGQSAVHLTRECVQIQVPVIGKTDTILVTHIVHPGHFYAVDVDYLLSLHEEDSLILKLQDFNNTSPLSCMPKVGDLLCGLFAGEWFRCEVIEIVDTQILVNFFDYGNESILDLSNLRTLPKELCDGYPVATFRCAIQGIRPAAGDEWDEETIKLFKELLENQQAELSVKCINDGVCGVSVKTPTGDVGEVLQESGKAVPHTRTNPRKEELQRQLDALKAQLAAIGDDE